MKAEDIVMIYRNPVTQETPEGKAKLIKQHRPDVGDGLSIWCVEFVDEPGAEYLRTVIEYRPMRFENDRVKAADVADFLARFYRTDRYHERGEEYAAALLASHQKHFDEYGYDIISRHDSVTGKVVAYFREEVQP